MAEYQNKTKSDHVLDIHTIRTRLLVEKRSIRKNKSGRMR